MDLRWRYDRFRSRCQGQPKLWQEIADKVAAWFTQNRVKLNGDKCKELRTSVVKDEPQFVPIEVDGNEIESD